MIQWITAIVFGYSFSMKSTEVEIWVNNKFETREMPRNV